MQTVAALTIMPDDAFFLKIWLSYYGARLGRENCYVISAGASPGRDELTTGCSVIRLPPDAGESLIRKRGRILNNLVAALLGYHAHVIVGNADELVVVDPAAGVDLRGFLQTMRRGQVLTPLGLELIHRVDCEPAPLGGTILGPRRHVRPAAEFTKPCVLSTAARLSRDGRFARHAKLNTPEVLYLLRLRYCDRSLSDDAPVFERFAAQNVQDGFDLGPLRRQMHDTWHRRAESAYWAFDCPEFAAPRLLPDRFGGLF